MTDRSHSRLRTGNKAISTLRLLLLAVVLLAPVALSTAQAAKKIPGDLVLPRSESSDASVEITPSSIFPHWIHRINYRCDACHDRLFKMELGASEISMDLMKNGGSCGACHNGEAAFAVSFQSCNRCHRSAGADGRE